MLFRSNRGNVDRRRGWVDSDFPEHPVYELGQYRLADPTQCQRRDGDAELRAGYDPIEVLQRGLNDLRASIAFGDHLLELAAAGGNERELGSHEETVQCNKAEDGKQAARRRGPGGSINRLCSNKFKEHMGCNLYSSRDLGSAAADN